MKRHPFLKVDFQSTVKLSATERRNLIKWLNYLSPVVQDLIYKDKVLVSLRPKKLRVSLLICGEVRIKKLNLEYRHKNKVTDVLSFPTFDGLRDSTEQDLISNGELHLGDLAICFQKAKDQAHEFKIGLWDEFVHLFIHGLIHLCGYDHEISMQEEKIMEAVEANALSRLSKLKSKN